jgi:hypothetical protein
MQRHLSAYFGTHISVGVDVSEVDALVPEPEPHHLEEEGAGDSPRAKRLAAPPRCHDVHLPQNAL